MEIEHMEMVYIYQYHKRWLEYIDLSHGNVGHGVFFPMVHGNGHGYKNSRRYGNGVLVNIP